MRKRAICAAIGICIITLTGSDLLVDHMSSNSVPRQVMRTIVNAPSMIDVLGIGNSLMAAGFVPGVIEETFSAVGQRCVAVNGGLGASDLIEHLTLTRLALGHHTVKTIVYGFFDNQMSSDILGRNSDLVGNHSMLYYLEPQLTLRYGRFDVVDRLWFQIYRSNALLRERSAIWTKVERLRRFIGGFGMPAQDINRFGRKDDFSLLEPKDTQTFVRACDDAIRGGEYISAPVRRLLMEAREHRTKVLVVEMPMHPNHLRRFYAQESWTRLITRTRAAVEDAGASYLDASTWIPDASLFEDALHLSKEGGRAFSRRLAQELLRQDNRPTKALPISNEVTVSVATYAK